MQIIIRKARPKDILTVYEQICKLENKLLIFNTFKNRFINNIYNKNIIYLVAIAKSKEIVGFISCHIQDLLHHNKKVAEIQELYVNQHFRNSGIGSSLIKALKNKLNNRNCESLEVTAQNKRKITHKFYMKNGLSKTHIKFTSVL